MVKLCSIKGCGKKHKGKGYCNKHHQQLLKGKVLDITRNDRNDVVYNDDFVEIVLRNINHIEIGRTRIDFDDLEKIIKYKWCLDSDGNKFEVQITKDNKVYLIGRFRDLKDAKAARLKAEIKYFGEYKCK